MVPLLAYTDMVTVNAGYDQWINWARIAWRYFDPGVGVNANTGLHYATSGWHRFTDWDLGLYIEAIIDAEMLGILGRDGAWGANYRLDKILSFLETRQLSGDGLPYWAYDADSGQVPGDVGTSTAHPSDSGKLLLALDDLRRFRPDLAARINSLVTRHSFQKFAESDYFAWNDIYPFYVAQGFSAFGYSTPKLRALESLGDGSSVEVYGETLPKARITSEPLMLALLENRSGGLYRTYVDRVFSAQQKRYEATGKLTAFSEGPYFPPEYYVYEWVVNANGETWVVYASGKTDRPPIVYSKIAFAFHAIYNNPYTSLLVNELSGLSVNEVTLRGFYEGKSENGETLNVLSDKTNGMILAAARYYVSHTSTTSSTSSSVTTSSPSTTGPLTTETSSTTSGPLTTETTVTSLSTETTSTIVGPVTTTTSTTAIPPTTETPVTSESTEISLSTGTTSTSSTYQTTSEAVTTTALETSTSQIETTTAGPTTESSRPPSPPCVIATAAYGSEMATEVVYMRYVRDNLIGSTSTGKVLREGFNSFYYSWSPVLAGAIAGSELLRALFRILMVPPVRIVRLAAISFQVFGGGDAASIMAFGIAALLVMLVYVAAPVLLLTLAIKRIRRGGYDP
jgi:hypothetical protein